MSLAWTAFRSRSIHVAAPARTTSTTRFVAWLCAAVVAVRVLYAFQPLRFDESGYLIVARHWDLSGPFLYGDYWVDRPPGLMLVFKLATTVEWSPQAIRLLAIPFAVLFVLASVWSAYLLAGRSACRRSALVAAALVSTPAMGADQVDGELIAVPLVVLAIALTLRAARAVQLDGAFGWACAAGVVAASAVLVKQNFVEAYAFAAVLLGASVFQRRASGRSAGVIVTGGLIGSAIPVTLTLLWAHAAGFDAARLWSDLVGFRLLALDTLADAPEPWAERGLTLLGLGVASGALVIVMVMAHAAWTARLRGSPEAWATGAVTVLGLVGVIGGGNYWLHYLLQLAPAVVLGTALVGGVLMKWLAGFAAVSAVVGCAVLTLGYQVLPWTWWPHQVGAWLDASSSQGDTIVVLYGSASVVESSGLESPYPYLWSLPVRVLDPDLTRLRATLTGAGAPTWLVEATGANSWDIDASHRLRSLIDDRYRLVGEVCDREVWLRQDLIRELAAVPQC
jgi:Dolichyl-phosphate-mannose-protein mannosyltransferase